MQLRVFLDRSVVEVYANGRVAFTATSDHPGRAGRTLGRAGERALTLFARGGQARAPAVDVWELTSIWGVRATSPFSGA